MMPARTEDASRQRQELVGWFMRRNGPQWSSSDEHDFQQWLATPANRAAFTQWEVDWALMDAMPQASADRLRAMVAEDRRTARPIERPRVARGRRRLLASGFAMAGVAAVAVTGGWLGWQHLQARPVYEQAFSTRKGQQSEVTLPDGSALRLDTATALKATFFRQRREIQLADGQAMFSVTADAHRPFHVTAGPVRITVVGTRFSVRLTPGIPGRQGVEVEVEEGRVRVARVHGPQERHNSNAQASEADAFELTAGERVAFDVHGDRPMLGTVPLDGVAGWRSSQLSFGDVPLQQAVAEMERYGSLGITAIDPATAQLRLTGTFDPRDAAATRRLLSRSLPIKLTPQGAGWEILPAR